MKKTLFLALASAGLLVTAGVAQARVGWSIGIELPGVATVVSNQPVYGVAPPVYAAPPVVYAQVPVYGAPPVRYAPAPVVYEQPYPYYGSAPVIVEPAYRRGDWGWRRWQQERWGHDHDRDRDHDHGRRDGGR